MIERSGKPAHARGRKSLLAAALAGWFAIGSAAAGTIGIDGSGRLVIGAEPSEADVTLTASTEPVPNPTVLSLFDPNGIFDLVTSGCSGGPLFPDGPNVFSCLLSGFTSILVIGSEGDDIFEFSGVLGIGATFAGLGGDDNITGTAAADVIYGGAGNDILFGDGLDALYAGPGEFDLVFGGPNLGADNPQFEPLPRQPVSVPAPGTLLLLLAGLAAAVAPARRR